MGVTLYCCRLFDLQLSLYPNLHACISNEKAYSLEWKKCGKMSVDNQCASKNVQNCGFILVAKNMG